MQGDRQCPGLLNCFGRVDLQSVGVEYFSSRDLSHCPFPGGFSPHFSPRLPVRCWAVGPACMAWRTLLHSKQAAVALTLLDFDRLGGESFRVLGKLPK